jgi:hypothetical protein
MTYTAPSFDYYDDGLVHGHDWARNTPPGSRAGESCRFGPPSTKSADHDDGLVHEHRWARS